MTEFTLGSAGTTFSCPKSSLGKLVVVLEVDEDFLCCLFSNICSVITLNLINNE